MLGSLIFMPSAIQAQTVPQSSQTLMRQKRGEAVLHNLTGSKIFAPHFQ